MLDIDVIKRWFDYLYSIGADETGGVTRLGYTKNEDVMHGAIRNFAREMGLKYSSDEVGNTYVYDEDYEEYYLIGSHLDSVISGGRYDGVVGVLAGLLILKWIKDNNLNIPLKVVAFRCEESSSFGIATVGSGLITKKLQIEKMKKVENTEGVSLYEALRFRGYNLECRKIEGVLNYFELHIEQGRILEDEGLKIGIINSIAAATRYWLTIDGRQDHSGATPMGMRQDALCAAGEIIIELENIAKRESIHSSVGTVGYLGNYPNAFNVVPGRVKMGLDIRGVEKDSIDRIDDEIVKFVDEVCKKRNLNYELDNISKAIPVKLDENLKNELSEVATKLGVEHKIMNSGAGHDAMKFWDIAPTGMVFIPCRDGVSHNKAEEIEYEDIILGSKIIFEELKQLNSRR
ncbi:M20 family metallo-hydrolase [uncultured Fusobacterium sp.]|mgnify:FL=1|jgi:hydantoinase/carbamoylase family amidase|uniref:M20 family metallo-hydrolase n=1 Tax=uncultured Fusobacterium sp. TaxID=159267 RepID=UPI0015A50844|nr:M20 family metallo-hydrolase [uncultured Fusobacterium sp.]